MSEQTLQMVGSLEREEQSQSDTTTAENLNARLETLKQHTYADLLLEWRRLFRAPPPKRIGQDLLTLGIAWKIQEQVFGGVSAGTKRTLADLARKVEQDGDVPRDRVVSLKPGAKLHREWRGNAA